MKHKQTRSNMEYQYIFEFLVWNAKKKIKRNCAFDGTRITLLLLLLLLLLFYYDDDDDDYVNSKQHGRLLYFFFHLKTWNLEWSVDIETHTHIKAGIYIFFFFGFRFLFFLVHNNDDDFNRATQ